MKITQPFFFTVNCIMSPLLGRDDENGITVIFSYYGNIVLHFNTREYV